MRRKFGILILVSVTVLAGTQEAVRQFDGLRSSLNDLTRASLWSGLIVYAQPVADGKLPSPQIYYLMPRVYEEVARNEPVAARRFKHDADAVAKVFAKEFNAAKIKAETERFVAAQE